MIKRLKVLWGDLGNLPKFQFFQKHILPALAIFFTWGFFSNLYLSSIKKATLSANKGRVQSLSVELERNTKYKYYPLKIKLQNYPRRFRVPDTYDNEFWFLKEEIKTGDTIIAYILPRWLSVINWGDRDDIYQIEKGGKTLFSITDVCKEKRNQVKYIGVFGLVIWIWYLSYRRIRHIDEREDKPPLAKPH